jgi:hypothetical protein
MSSVRIPIHRVPIYVCSCVQDGDTANACHAVSMLLSAAGGRFR